MIDSKDYNLLLSLEASCRNMMKKFQELRLKAEQDVNPTKKRRKKAGLTPEQIAWLDEQQEKRILRTQQRFAKENAVSNKK
jgi:hypothetical protein